MKVLCVLQFYNRHHNMKEMLDQIRMVESISEVVILDNNPEVKIPEVPANVQYIKSSDHKGCMYRLEFLYGKGREYLDGFDRILLIDDDVLLRHTQIKLLLSACEGITKEVGVGVCGQDLIEGNGYKYLELRHNFVNSKVDILNQVYFLTSYHILDLLPRNLTKVVGKVSFSEVHVDDIASTFSRGFKNILKAVGEIKSCPTYCTPGIALHKESTFTVTREAFISRL